MPRRPSRSEAQKPRAGEELPSRAAIHRGNAADTAEFEEASAAPRPRRRWLACFYLCGDFRAIATHIARNVEEILEAGDGEELFVAVHWDRSPLEGGAVRFIVGGEKEEIGIVNTGDGAPLRRFLLWATERCPSDHVALVMGGMGIFEGLTQKQPDALPIHDAAKHWSQLFSICDDQTAGDAMDIFDLAWALREVKEERKRDYAVDLAVFDLCDSGFIEVAAELEGLVPIAVAPQTRVPIEGLRYKALLDAWRALAAGPAPVEEWGTRTAAIAELSYRISEKGLQSAVTTLDLRNLRPALRAFDVFTIALVQYLGETLVWRGRELVIQDRERFRVLGEGEKDFVYDLDALLESIESRMKEVAQASRTSWLDERAARALTTRRRYWALEIARRLERSEGAGSEAHEAAAALRKPTIRTDPPYVLPEWIRDPERAKKLETALEVAVEAAWESLPEDVRDEIELLELQKAHAEQLSSLAGKVRLLLKPGAGPVLRAPTEAGRGGICRGISIYRPFRLDELRDLTYLGLRFHRESHWAVYLAACNLIQDHATSLWRVVTSLLATASPVGRADVVRALTGTDSLLIGFRRQLQGLSQPSCRIVTLDREASREASSEREYYRLRLDSPEPGATVEQHENRIQPRVIDALLTELDRLLESASLDKAGVKRLQAIGETLGQDVLQGRVGKSLSDLEVMRDLAQMGPERKTVSDAPARPSRRVAPEEHEEEPIHLQLQLPMRLMRYPWELLHDSKGWIGDRYAIARAVFMEVGTAARRTAKRQGGIRALIIADPELAGAVPEAEAVANAFETAAQSLGPLIDLDGLDCRMNGIGCCELRHLLASGEYDIVHFAGHAAFHADDPEQSAWQLRDGKLWAIELARTLAASKSPPWLIYANACQSSKEAPAPRYQGEVYGLATACLGQGVAAYVGSISQIGDGVAWIMAERFYEEFLSRSASLGTALWRARRHVKELVLRDGHPAPHGLGWAGLVHYGDPTAGLLQLLGSRNPRHAPPERAGLG